MSWVYTRHIGGVTCDGCPEAVTTDGPKLPSGWSVNLWSGLHYCEKCTAARAWEKAERDRLADQDELRAREAGQ